MFAQRPCLSENQCFDYTCQYLHPNLACIQWSDCRHFDCPNRHGLGRTRPCRDGKICVRWDCQFLHEAGRDLWKPIDLNICNAARGKAKKNKRIVKSEGKNVIKVVPVSTSGVVWRHPGTKHDNKKACGVCVKRKPRKDFRAWNWASFDGDLSLCKVCLKGFPWKAREARLEVNKRDVREWVIKAKSKLGLMLGNPEPYKVQRQQQQQQSAQDPKKLSKKQRKKLRQQQELEQQQEIEMQAQMQMQMQAQTQEQEGGEITFFLSDDEYNDEYEDEDEDEDEDYDPDEDDDDDQDGVKDAEVPQISDEQRQAAEQALAQAKASLLNAMRRKPNLAPAPAPAQASSSTSSLTAAAAAAAVEAMEGDDEPAAEALAWASNQAWEEMRQVMPEGREG